MGNTITETLFDVVSAIALAETVPWLFWSRTYFAIGLLLIDVIQRRRYQRISDTVAPMRSYRAREGLRVEPALWGCLLHVRPCRGARGPVGWRPSRITAKSSTWSFIGSGQGKPRSRSYAPLPSSHSWAMIPPCVGACVPWQAGDQMPAPWPSASTPKGPSRSGRNRTPAPMAPATGRILCPTPLEPPAAD